MRRPFQNIKYSAESIADPISFVADTSIRFGAINSSFPRCASILACFVARFTITTEAIKFFLRKILRSSHGRLLRVFALALAQKERFW